MKKYLLLISTLAILITPSISLADCPAAGDCRTTGSGGCLNLNLEYPCVNGVDLNADQDLNQIALWFYYFIIFISGIAAFVSIVWGGFDWLTSAGNSGKLSTAKDRIQSALLGLLIILSSYIIMKVINPELLIFKLPGLQ